MANADQQSTLGGNSSNKPEVDPIAAAHAIIDTAQDGVDKAKKDLSAAKKAK